jgi:succinate dehydrogenase/fumarate reductase flavoprotein subunit
MAIKVMDCDLVVLGAGGAGLVAAVMGAEASGKKVIVLEKAKKPGGATMFAAGIKVMDSQWQKEAGEKVNDPPDVSGLFFDWLVSKGGAEKYFYVTKPDDERSAWSSIHFRDIMDKYKGHPQPGHSPGWMGTYVVTKMLERCEKMGIPVLTETRARKFITDSRGKVTGVLAETKDGQLQVNCKACFIGAGGFGADYEKCRKIWPYEFNNKPMLCVVPRSITGDCIDMAEEIGAAIDLSNAWFTGGASPCHFPYSSSIGSISDAPEVLTVNMNGERWMLGDDVIKEIRNGSGITPHADSLANQPLAGAFSIADSDMVQKVAERNIARESTPSKISILKKWREEIAFEVEIDEKGAKGDHTKKADTFSELALKMDVDPKVFLATIERYNKICENGKDPDFGKDPKNLVPILKPPFYAFYMHRFSQCTKGGIVVSYDTSEVFDKNGGIMPGLFAGGDGITFKEVKRTKSLQGLTNCVTTGYKGGIAAGNYLKNL